MPSMFCHKEGDWVKTNKLMPVCFVIFIRREIRWKIKSYALYVLLYKEGDWVKKEEVMFCTFFSSPGRCGSGGEGCWRSLLTGVTMANHGRFPARETDEQPGWPDWEGPTVPGGELLFLQSGWNLSVSQHVGGCTKGVLDQGNAVLLTANRNVRNDFSYLPWVEQTFLISWQSLPKVF